MSALAIDADTSLKALCNTGELAAAVQIVAHAVSNRSPLQILTHILIQTDADSLRLIATDMELGISCRIPAQVQEPGALTAPARTLSEVLGNLPDKSEIALSVDKSHTVRLRCERSDYKILGLPIEEYPSLPEVADAVSFAIPQSLLREMIRQTLFAASTDDARAIFTGILMVVESETLRLVATDTHRLALKTARLPGVEGARTAVIPSRALNEVVRQLSDSEGEVHITLSGNQALFVLPGEEKRQIVTRLLEGQFPNYQRVIPPDYKQRLVIPTQPFLQALRRAAIVARDMAHRVALRTEQGRLTITAESQLVGSAYEEVEVSYEGGDIEMAINVKYLLDAVSGLEEEELYLDIVDASRPGVLRPVTRPKLEPEEGKENTPERPSAQDYLCLIMPMSI